jgi:hypothetical protein
MSQSSNPVFLSYVHEDRPAADRIADALEDCGFEVWIDHRRLLPGTRWKDRIREAVRDGSALIACFSAASIGRVRTYANEELILAAEEVRLRPRSAPWLFPVRLDPTPLPDFSLGGGERLSDLQDVRLWEGFDEGIDLLVRALTVR